MSKSVSQISSEELRLAVLQIAPVYLDGWATWEKLKSLARKAVSDGAEVLTWGETLIPGYPSWISIDTSDRQLSAWFRYWTQAVTLDDPLVADIKAFAREQGVMLVGGVAEREGASVYSTIITIGADGALLGRHRKLKPTWRERLVWADGDGKGLRAYPTKIGKIGSLNCWENWLPLARAALHQQEEFIHVGTWPGNEPLVSDITKFIALEGRTWSVAASGLLRASDFEVLDAEEFPVRAELLASPIVLQDGASQIVAPDGCIVAGPLVGEEGVVAANLDARSVVEQRQILDSSGHYSRPDVLKLTVVDSTAEREG